MTPFQKRLQAHKGGLLYLKTELYWYNRGARDGVKGRHCVLLDAPTKTTPAIEDAVTPTVEMCDDLKKTAVTLLLIDGTCSWVWMAKEDVELL
jgi:hypothetical protein